MRDIIVIAQNIRSTHNVGSIFRTAEGFGVSRIILSGYTPYPLTERETRLPHIANKLDKQIHKTALGAETMVAFDYRPELDLAALKSAGYTIVGLEQDDRSITLSDFDPPQKTALVIGEEVDGLSDDMRDQCDVIVEIPMAGKKESFNVSVATGIALYHLANAAA